MSKPRFVLIVLSLALIVGLMGGCRRRQPTPTPSPTPLPVTATPAPTPTVSAIDPASIDWPPQVVYSSPAPGEEVLLDGAILLRFDQPMDQPSVEEALQVQAVDSAETAAGAFTWPRPDTVIFTPADKLRREQRYHVQLSADARSAKGQALAASVSLDIQTVGYLQIAQVIPADGSQAVKADSAITVLFNRPVVPLVSTAQQTDLPRPLIIDPPLAGQGEWVSTSIYRFTPDAVMDGATTYHISVAAGLTDVTGGLLEEPFTWSFVTDDPAVILFEPPDGATSLDPESTLTVTFNMPMDPALTEAAISLAPAAPLAFAWSEDGRSVALTPQTRLELQTTYRLTVAQTARAASGQASLKAAAVTTFTTFPLPRVDSVYPEPNAVVDFFDSLSVSFASPMNPDTLDGQVTIQPAPDKVGYYLDPSGFYMRLDVNLTRNTLYTVTIPGRAADIYGNVMGADYVWSFRTADYPAIASFNAPGPISQASTSFPTQLDIIHRKVSALQVQLYNFDGGLPLDFLDAGSYFEQVTPRGLLRAWNLPADPTGDQAQVVNLPLADGGVLPTGVYFLSLTGPEVSSDTRWWQNQRHLLIVADTNLTLKETPDYLYVWATDLATGQPAAGLNVTFYYGGAAIGTATTDADGLAQQAKPAPDPQQYYSAAGMAVSNAPGQSGFGIGRSDWSQSVSPWEFGLPYGGLYVDPLYYYMVTDRPIYRPGDTVYFRGYVRSAESARYPLAPVQNVKVTLAPFGYYENQQPLELGAPVDDNGGFSGEFAIPTDLALGGYGLYVTSAPADPNAGYGMNPINITIAEYRKPEFVVTVSAAKSDILRGEATSFSVDASYFSGGPASDLRVTWTVSSSPYTPPWEGPYYNFTNDDAPFDYSVGVLATGEGVTDGHGQLTVNLPADLLDTASDDSLQVTFEATIYDISQFPVAARANLIAHQADIYVGVVATDYLAAINRPASVNLITVDWEQQPVSDVAYEVVFYQREWQSRRGSGAFGGYTTIWEPIDTEAGRASGVTDADGQGAATFTPTQGGSYIAKVTAADEAGHVQRSIAYLYVLSSDYGGWRTSQRERRMDLTADRREYTVGDTAEVLVQSPFAGPVRAWVTIERGNVLEQYVTTLQTSSDVLTLPISDLYAPNAFVSVAAVKGVDASAFQYADIRLGVTELVVRPDPFALNVSVTPDREQYGPRDTVVYAIVVTDEAGRPVPADLSLALVDLAVLSLKPDNATPIVEAFYARQPFRSQTGAGLFISGEGLDVEEPLQIFGGGGGGGGAADELAPALRENEDEADVRRDFRDTAYWSARTTTDATGRATVRVTLPDNLTTWRLSAKAVSLQTGGAPTPLVGQTTRDILATRPVLIRPVTPRFFTVGDRVELGAVVNNNTGGALQATVSLAAEGVVLEGSAETTLMLPAQSNQLVRWSVRVPDVNAVDLTFRAAADGYSDASKPTVGAQTDGLLPVYRYNAPDIVGTAGSLDEAGRRVEALLLPSGLDPSLGGVEVRLSPSLGAAVLDALAAVNYVDDRSNCAYSWADQLLPNAAVAGAIRQLNLDKAELLTQLDTLIPADMQRLADLQSADGGWSWCPGGLTDPYITAYSLLALIKAAQAGYSPQLTAVDQARAYLAAQLLSADKVQTAQESNRQAFFLYVLAEAGADVRASLDALVMAHRDLLDPYAAALLILADDSLGGGPNRQLLLNDLAASVIVSATGAHWEDTQPDYFNLSSDIRGTAMILLALARVDPANTLAPNAVRWLMAARQVQRWSTWHESAWSILSLTAWMQASGELQADYSYSLALNTTPLLDGAFTPATVLDSATASVSLNQLFPEAVNFFNFQRAAGSGRLYYTAHLTAFVAADSVQALNRGVVVQRAYYDAACQPEEETCAPLTTSPTGQAVRVELTIIAPHDLTYVVVEDPLPAGAEAVDPNLETSTSNLDAGVASDTYRWGYWGWWYFDRIEFRDAKVVFTSHFLPAGTYQYTYYLQPIIPGDYQVMPTLAQEAFFPEVFGRSDGLLFTITAAP